VNRNKKKPRRTGEEIIEKQVATNPKIEKQKDLELFREQVIY
jgi:predicted kinase